MRKRNIEKLFDTIIWSLITLLPILGYLIYLQSFGANPAIVEPNGATNNATIVSFSSYMSYSGFYPATSGVIYNAFASLLGNNGTLPLVTEQIVRLFVWIAHVQIAHLLVDVLLWLPRIAHKLMDKSLEVV